MQRSTIQTVEQTILDSYIGNTEPLTVIEIRGQCKLSETIIRKAANESPRIAHTRKDVRIMSKNYPGVVHQYRAVDAFQPTREWLVEIINKTRREYDYFRTERKWNG